MNAMQKPRRYESEKLRRAIASMPCIECGAEGCQHAHANTPPFGKGGALKAHDWAGFPLCADRPMRLGCHAKHDQNAAGLSKSERIDVEAMYIARTLGALIERGLLVVK
jgi:hypothetical protein